MTEQVTVYADVQTQGYLHGVDLDNCPGGSGSYSTARSNCDGVVTGDLRAGQRFTDSYCGASASTFDSYYVYMTSLEFDLSGIPAGSSVTAATLSLYAVSNNSNVDFVLQSYTETENIVDDGCTMWDVSPNGTLCTTHNTSAGWGGGFVAQTSDAAFAGQVTAKIGSALMLSFISLETVNNSAPTSSEYVTWQNPTSTPGTDPKLVITYQPASHMLGHNF